MSRLFVKLKVRDVLLNKMQIANLVHLIGTFTQELGQITCFKGLQGKYLEIAVIPLIMSVLAQIWASTR